MLPNLAVAAVLIIVVVNIVLIALNQWRWMSVAWVFQVFAIFWLTTLSWSISQSAVKLISGWIAIAIVSAARPETILEKDSEVIAAGFGFRFLSVGMTWLLAFSITPAIQNIIPARIEIIWGGVLLIAGGLLQIGLSRNIVRSILGLLTFLGGFEILYASVESSVLVSGLLALINIGLAWLAIYFLSTSGEGS
jgi:hypothetical protein